MRIAKQRAVAREREALAEAEAAKNAPPVEAAPPVAAAPPPAAAPDAVAAPAAVAEQAPEKPKRVYEHSMPYEFSSIDPNGRFVAHKSTNGTIGVYDPESGKLLREIFNRNLDATCIGFGESGQSMIVGDRKGAYKIFALGKLAGLDRYQQRKYTFGDFLAPTASGEAPLSCVGLSDDGNVVAAGDTSGGVRLWPMEEKAPQKLEGESTPIRQLLTVNGDQTLFAISSSRIAYWQLAKSAKSEVFENSKLETPSTITLLAPNNASLLIADEKGQVTLWNSPTPEFFQAHEKPIREMTYLPGNSDIITVDGTGEVAWWPLPLKQPLSEMKPRERKKFGGDCTVARCEPKNNRIATANGNSVSVYELETSNTLEFSVDEGMSVFELAWVDEGNQLVCVAAAGEGDEGLLVQWNVKEALIQKIMAESPLAAGQPAPPVAAPPVAATPAAAESAAPGAATGEVAAAVPDKPATPFIETARRVLRKRPSIAKLAPGAARMAVAFASGACDVVEVGTLNTLQSIEPTAGLTALGFSSDASKLFMGTSDGSVHIHFLRSLGYIQASDGPIVFARFHDRGARLFLAGKDGNITLWDRNNLSKPKQILDGPELQLEQASVSPDFKYAVARYAGAEPTICVWEFGGGNEVVAPKFTLTLPNPCRAVVFNHDSTKLVIDEGDRFGVINLADKARLGEVSTNNLAFSVAECGLLPDRIVVVANSEERQIVVFSLPVDRPIPGAALPQGYSILKHRLIELSPSAIEAKIPKDDPYANARAALIEDRPISEVAAGMGGDGPAQAAVATAYSKLTEAIGKGADLGVISKLRQELANARGRLKIDNLGKDYTAGMVNGQVIAETNFDFRAFPGHISIDLQFSENYIYALPPKMPKTPADESKTQEIGLSDNNFLLSWQYMLGIPVHAWDVSSHNISVIVPIVKSGNIISGPDIFSFNRDGSSKLLFADSSGFATKTYEDYSSFVTTGANALELEEHDLVRIYRLVDLFQPAPKPISTFRGYEAVVFGGGFANKRKWMSFGVRERAVSRLFAADLKTMTPKELQRFSHDKPWIGGESAAPGPQFSRFSPDDKVLVTWSEPLVDQFTLTVWDCTWDDDQLVNCKPRYTLSSKAPFFQLRGQEACWFISKKDDRSDLRMLVRPIENNRFEIWNLDIGRIDGFIPYVPTQYSEPECAVSSDGCWIFQGDDKGMLYAWDTRTGERFCVTLDEDSAKTVAETGSRLGAVERPAHTSPIVGIAVSESQAEHDFPSYVATLGEDNKLKLWDLYPVLNESMRQVKASGQKNKPKSARRPSR